MKQNKLNKILIVVVAILSVVIILQTVTSKQRNYYDACIYTQHWYHNRSEEEAHDICKDILEEME
jgi:hypothetical protein